MLIINLSATFLFHFGAGKISIKAVFLDRVNIIAEYESEVRSSSFSMKIPSVIALKKYIPISKKPPFTRFNLFLRDNFTCQYCGDIFNSNELTFDHVIPKSKGGETKWENVVAACAKCNLKKSDLLLTEVNMKLIKKPFTPTNSQLQVVGKSFHQIIFIKVGWIMSTGILS